MIRGFYISFFACFCILSLSAQHKAQIQFKGVIPSVSKTDDLVSLHQFKVENADSHCDVVSSLYLNEQLCSKSTYHIGVERTAPSQPSLLQASHNSRLLAYVDTMGELPPGRWRHTVRLANGIDTVYTSRSFTLRSFESLDSLLRFKHVRVQKNHVWFALKVKNESHQLEIRSKGLKQKDSLWRVPLHSKVFIGIYEMGFLLGKEEVSALTLTKKYGIKHALNGTPSLDQTKNGFSKNVEQVLKNPIVQPSIGFETELNLSDIDTLYGLLPANFYRIRLQPKVSVLGIPFQSDFYYTSESGFGYQMNSINLQLDRAAIETSLREKAHTQMQDYRVQVLELNYKERLAKERVQWQERALQKCAEKAEASKTAFEDSILQLRRGLVSKASDSLVREGDSLQHQLDSLEAQLKVDSLHTVYIEKQLEYAKLQDSLNEQMALAKSSYEAVLARKTAIDQRIYELKALKNGGFSNPELLDSAAFVSKTEKVLLAINNLQVGRHYLQTDPSDFSSVPVDGLSFDYQHRWMLAGVSVANFSPQNLLFDQTLAGSNTYGIKRVTLGFGDQEQHSFKANMFHITHKAGAELHNNIMAFNYYNALYDGFDVQMDLSLSEHYLPGTGAGIGLQSFEEGNYRFILQTEAKLYKDVLKGSYYHSETGANYTAVTSPFLRNDLRRQQLNLHIKPNDNFSFDLYRKTEATLQPNASDFHMTGYGFTGLYKNTKGLQIMASYLPFNYEVDIINYHRLARTRSNVVTLSAFKQIRAHTLGFQATQMRYNYNELNHDGLYCNYALLWQGSMLQHLSFQSQVGFNNLRQGNDSQRSLAWNAMGNYELSDKISARVSMSRQANLLTGLQQSRIGTGLQWQLFGLSTGLEFGYMQIPIGFESLEVQEGYYFNLGIRNSLF